MAVTYDRVRAALQTTPRTWLITGAAGFVGSNLLETLLLLDQRVVGLDNFSTGHRRNLDEACDRLSKERATRFRMIEGDIRDASVCATAVSGVDYVLHQAALGSVPRSVADPAMSNAVNISGFLNMLIAARDAGVARFVYAASSSTYGDHAALPKVESVIGRPLSPYAVTKYVNELYADVFSKLYGFHTIGLRYFNVFGRRQDPDGPYSAVIPRWMTAIMEGRQVNIYGDGETSRDFCYIDNAVQANILAATSQVSDALNQVYNVAVGDQTTLNQLFEHIRDALEIYYPRVRDMRPAYCEPRIGDVRHSLADISKARRLLGYEPSHNLREGLVEASAWYVNNLQRS